MTLDPLSRSSFTLLRGVTGFRDIRDPELPSTDFDRFVSDTHRVIERLPARLSGQPKRCGPASNYHTSAVLIDDFQVFILLNATYPLLAFATKKQGSLIFVDHQKLENAYAAYGRYSILDQSTLTQAPDDDAIKCLTPAETNQLSYWKPPTLGEIIFNHWD